MQDSFCGLRSHHELTVTFSYAYYLPTHSTSWSSLAKALIFLKINLLCSKRDSQGNLLFYKVAFKENTKDSSNIFAIFIIRQWLLSFLKANVQKANVKTLHQLFFFLSSPCLFFFFTLYRTYNITHTILVVLVLL